MSEQITYFPEKMSEYHDIYPEKMSEDISKPSQQLPPIDSILSRY